MRKVKTKHKKKIKELERKLNIANSTVAGQIEYIQDLEKSNNGLRAFIEAQENQLEIAEKAIERKDKQFYGLRSAYQDEIINRGEGECQKEK